jgi:hypothetical protein
MKMSSINTRSEKELHRYLDRLESEEMTKKRAGYISAEAKMSSVPISHTLAQPITLAVPPSAKKVMPRYKAVSSILRVSPRRLVSPIFLPVAGFKEIKPVPMLGDPLTIDDFLLWPDPSRNRAFFTLSTPRLLDLNLTIQREVVEGTIEITGGNALFIVTAYSEESIQETESYRQVWSDRLEQGGYGRRNWKFQPLNLRNLEGILYLPSDHQIGETQITVSSEAGTATFLVELSKLGARAWKSSIEQGRPDGLQGICRLEAKYLAQLGDRVEVKLQTLSASIGALARDIGPDVIQTVNPQISVGAHVIVEGDPNIEDVIVDWRPSEGTQPQSLIFGPEGGHFSTVLTSEDINSIYIDWNAKVNYKPAGWPVVKQAGRLSFTDNSWSVIINPASWILNYSIIAMLLDANGSVVAASSDGDLENRVQGELTFQAEYIKRGVPLITTFETGSQQIVSVPFPLPPGQSPTEAKLSTFASRSYNEEIRHSMKVRLLNPNETMIAVKIYPDARIEVVTNQDPVGEFSLESKGLNQLEMLCESRPIAETEVTPS